MDRRPNRIAWDAKLCSTLTRPRDVGAKQIEQLPEHLDSHIDFQLLEFVSAVAYSFKKEASYHNFEHACHVLMSFDRLLSQVANSYLNPAPWAKFACLLAALIRDFDPPETLGLDGYGDDIHIATQSVLNQHSTDMAYALLMDEKFQDLRLALCATKSEYKCFWRMVGNLVLATDTSDGTLSRDRDERWRQLWDGRANGPPDAFKFTSVLEHIALISQEVHAVHHWENYQKWSESLLEEYTEAHSAGDLWIDPKSFWRKTQLDYFDNLIIPLAKKMDEAGVLGTIGSEFDTYANQNRQEIASSSKDQIYAATPAPSTSNRQSAVTFVDEMEETITFTDEIEV